MTRRPWAQRLNEVSLSPIRRIMDRAGGCLNLGLGEPDFPAPKAARREARRMLREGRIGYTANAGLPELREAVHAFHGARRGHSVCVTNGSQEALFNTLAAVVDPGDEVLIPDPGFPAYKSIVNLCGGTPVVYPLPSGSRFQPDETAWTKLVGDRTRAVLINSPSNPTGQCLAPATLRALANLAERRGFLIVSDEVYREVHFLQGKPATLLDFTDRGVVLSGVSKMAAMTGWRLGWAVGPADLIEKITVVHQYTTSCASLLSQRAALAVLTDEGLKEVESLRRRMKSGRDTMCRFLDDEIRRAFVPPQGALYVMLSVGDLGMDSFSVALALIDSGVATIPGSAFGSQSEGFLRLSFACRPKVLDEGLRRLRDGLAKLGSATDR